MKECDAYCKSGLQHSALTYQKLKLAVTFYFPVQIKVGRGFLETMERLDININGSVK